MITENMMTSRILFLLIAVIQLTNTADLSGRTKVSVSGERWLINGQVTNPGTEAEGLLTNTRMVNATFEDRFKPGFSADENANTFIAGIPGYVNMGVNAFTLNLQGGMPGYEGALNSAFDPDGSLRGDYMSRVDRVIRACDKNGVIVILGFFYQRQ